MTLVAQWLAHTLTILVMNHIVMSAFCVLIGYLQSTTVVRSNALIIHQVQNTFRAPSRLWSHGPNLREKAKVSTDVK